MGINWTFMLEKIKKIVFFVWIVMSRLIDLLLLTVIKLFDYEDFECLGCGRIYQTLNKK
tara:strand:- start:1855 stop:2031 length:177 start_codon:yes stop_codon:yes gene_type:complete